MIPKRVPAVFLWPWDDKRCWKSWATRCLPETSSFEALEAFRVQPDRIDLVITDQTMPNMTGNVLAQELMCIKPSIPIILRSGFSELMDPQKIKSMGISELVMKPL